MKPSLRRRKSVFVSGAEDCIMGAEYRYRCPSCGFSRESWDDGMSYVRDEHGKRFYFCHPGDVTDACMQMWNVEREEVDPVKVRGLVIGHESDHLCRRCLRVSRFDPKADPHRCQHCHSEDVVGVPDLKGQPCPKCHAGTLIMEWTGTIS